MKIPYTITDENVSVFLGGKMYLVPSEDFLYFDIIDELRCEDHDVKYIKNLVDKFEMLRGKIKGADLDGNVTIVDEEVFYQGTPIHNSLTMKLIRLMRDGFDATPWIKFLDKLMSNPSYRSREQLHGFLEKYTTPITPEGNFLAFKRVRDNFTDIHTGTFDNTPGKVVKMDRQQVDDDPNRTCSAGLHACASNYLGSFYSSTAGYKVVVVEINPAHVVSIPTDYNFSKMRVSEYKVLGEVNEEFIDILDKSEYYDWNSEPEVDDYVINYAWGPDDSGIYHADSSSQPRDARGRFAKK